MKLTNFKKRIYTSFGLILLIYFIINYDFILGLSLIIMGIYSLLEFFNISKKIIKNKIYLTSVNIFFFIYVFLFCSTFFFFSNFLQLKLILYLLLFSCIASDIGGFIFGKIFKGPKLTKISPNKTISGAIGSIIFTTLSLLILTFLFINQFDYFILIVGFITSVACQIGDLFFSYLKRKANIKDTGRILPGHGGILDRLDGIFVGIPIGFSSIIFIY
jgi:phosphatidate cytidylyltransferase